MSKSAPYFFPTHHFQYSTYPPPFASTNAGEKSQGWSCVRELEAEVVPWLLIFIFAVRVMGLDSLYRSGWNAGDKAFFFFFFLFLGGGVVRGGEGVPS